jgi:hypothetical protein
MQQQLSIQERGETPEGWQAVVRFNNGPENPITISNPFTDTHGSLKSGRKNEKLVHSGNERSPEH